ncbi:MAG: DnaJ domain-containing protein [Planctomycetota bacterium]
MNITTLDGALTLLGLSGDASPEAVRARYRDLVKACPPERDAERFMALRKAFEIASDPEARAQDRVNGPVAYESLDELIEDLGRQPRRPIGADAWREVLRR